MEQYHTLLNKILIEGSIKDEARANMPNTTSLFGYQIRYDLKEGFPILTTKKVSFKNIVTELLWFLKGDTNVKYLIDNGCNIWCEDSYNFYKKKIDENLRGSDDIILTFEEFCEKIKTTPKENLPKFKNYTLGSCGVQYGRLWRNLKGLNDNDEVIIIDQFKDLVEGLKTNPFSRRHIISAWNPFTLNDMSLNSCHALVQFNCRVLSYEERKEISGNFLTFTDVPKYYLDCQMYQRSGDVFLGICYNSASYSLLLHIIAKMCGMVAGTFIHTFGDVHIYENHLNQVNEQLSRNYNKYKIPSLVFSDSFNLKLNLYKETKNLNDFIDSLEINDFKLDGYESYPPIKAELSTGLIK